MSTSLRSVGLLDVLLSTPAGPSVARLVSMRVCAASLRNPVRNAGLAVPAFLYTPYIELQNFIGVGIGIGIGIDFGNRFGRVSGNKNTDPDSDSDLDFHTGAPLCEAGQSHAFEA